MKCTCATILTVTDLMQVFDDFGSYMKSLYKLRDLQQSILYPGHGPVVANGVEKINQYIEHRLAREKQVL